MSNRLSGKAALVTGGSRGIGAAIVRRLANEGAAVAFTYSASSEKAVALVGEIEASGGSVLTINADSADPQAVKAAVAQTVARFGRLDILVNNAGILIGGMVDDYGLADFDRIWDELFPAEQARLVRLLVERVDVSDDGIRVRLRTEGLRDVVRELQGDPTLDQAA